MEVKLEKRFIDSFKEITCQNKQIQETVETVVPDIAEDIGNIALVQSCVLLKSKDVSGRGVFISGELKASVLYITEDQDKFACLRVNKSFTMEYEIADLPADTVAQIRLSVLSTEARLLNPRKVSLCFNISGGLSCYSPEKLCAESGFTAENAAFIHSKYESVEVNTVSAAGEKTFILNEQLAFPGGKPKPTQIVDTNIAFNIGETQRIGTKLMIKGTLNADVTYLSEELNYPIKAEFCTAFSQIAEIGECELSDCVISPEATSVYYELGDSMNGDKLLNLEIHGVMQYVCYSPKELAYISDAYCNMYTIEAERDSVKIKSFLDRKLVKLSCDEKIFAAENCSEILFVYVNKGLCREENSQIKILLNMNVVYRDTDGNLCSVLRGTELNGELPKEKLNYKEIKVCDAFIRADGAYIDCHLSVELKYLEFETREFEAVSSVHVDEEEPTGYEQYPNLSLVKCEDESLWELAKNYHSSPEKIRELNGEESELKGKMVLVPRSL